MSELRHAFRRLSHAPAFSLTAVGVLALALYASASIFVFVDAAMVRPLPYAHANRLVSVFGAVPGTCPRCRLSYLDFLDLGRLSRSYESLSAFASASFTVDTGSGPISADGARVTAGFFKTLGVRLAIGDGFAGAAETSAPSPVVIVSDRVWRTRYGRDPRAAGGTITLDRTSYAIVGVLPADFHFAPVGPADYWTLVDPTSFCEQRRGCHNLTAVGLLRAEVAPGSAQSETAQVARQLERQYPDTNRGQSVAVVPLVDAILGDVRPVLLTLTIGAALLLIIALVNVINLALIRSDGRRQELAIRTALGASIRRLIAQTALEAGILCGAAGVIATVASGWTLAALRRLIPTDLMVHLPFFRDVALNAHALLLIGTATAIATAALAVAPRAHRTIFRLNADLHEGTRGAGGRTWSRVGARLVVVELAIATTLLAGAGLLTDTMYRLLHVELGFDPHRLAAISVNLAGAHPTSGAQLTALADRIEHAVRALPGVEAVARVSALPVGANDNTEWVRIVGRPYQGEHDEIVQRYVSANYLQTIDARLRAGRFFTSGDGSAAQPVTIVNRAFARRYFGGDDAIGRQVGDIALDASSLRTIVGVIDDVREGPVESELWPAEYRPSTQRPRPSFRLVARTTMNPRGVLSSLAAAIATVGGGVSTSDATTIDDRVAASPAVYLHRSLAVVAGAFAAISSLLGLVGLHGVVSYSMSRRTREFGIRVALGAQRRQVLSLVLRETGVVIGTGVGAGLIGAAIAGRLGRALLFDVQPWDPLILGFAAAAMAATALVAGYLPARRATAIDPMNALRVE